MAVPPGATMTTTRRLQEDPSTACEDLKFFEKRLTEVITHMGPPCTRWRIAIVIFAVVIGVTGSKYLANEMDNLFGIFSFRTPFSRTDPVTWLDVLVTTHLDFTICIIVGLILFGCFGVHRRIVAPTIIARRCRDALSPFSLSCDHNGKLIVKKAVRNPPQ